MTLKQEFAQLGARNRKTNRKYRNRDRCFY